MSNNSLEIIKRCIAEFESKHNGMLTKLMPISDKVIEACDKIDRSWSKSFAGYHGELYFKDFEEPELRELFNPEWGGINGIPKGWNKKKPEEVKTKIEQLTGNKFSLELFEEDGKKLIENARATHTEILILFSTLNMGNNMIPEKELLTRLEDLEFSRGKESFIAKMIPSQIITRDLKALSGGTCIPSHIYYKGIGLSVKQTCITVKEFINLTNRLTRQIESKIKLVIPSSAKKLVNYWNLVNPFWLLWKLFLKSYQLLKLMWKHKVISSLILLIGLLAVDYALALKNVKFLLSLFHYIIKRLF